MLRVLRRNEMTSHKLDNVRSKTPQTGDQPLTRSKATFTKSPWSISFINIIFIKMYPYKLSHLSTAYDIKYLHILTSQFAIRLLLRTVFFFISIRILFLILLPYICCPPAADVQSMVDLQGYCNDILWTVGRKPVATVSTQTIASSSSGGTLGIFGDRTRRGDGAAHGLSIGEASAVQMNTLDIERVEWAVEWTLRGCDGMSQGSSFT